MAYMPNNGVMSAPGPRGAGPAAGAPAVGRVTGVLSIAAAMLVFAMFWLPVASVRFYNRSWETYVWKGNAGPRVPDYVAAVPYALIVLVAAVTGILLVTGMGARRSVLFWVAAFAGGMVLLMSSGDVMTYAQGFKETISPASGFWVITLAMLVAIAALVSALRDAATSKRGVGQENNAAAGGAADRVAGVFLIAAAAVELAATFEPVDSGHSNLRSIWRVSSDGSAPLPMVHLVLILIIVVVVAIALLAGAGVRNPSMRAAGAAAAALVFTSEFNGLFVTFAMMGPKFWEYMGIGLVLLVLALLLSFGATVAGLAAQSARPRPVTQPRPSFAAMNAAPHPFASAPNPFAPVPAANPFAPAPPAPAVEATVKIEPAQAVTPPRMARVYDGIGSRRAAPRGSSCGGGEYADGCVGVFGVGADRVGGAEFRAGRVRARRSGCAVELPERWGVGVGGGGAALSAQAWVGAGAGIGAAHCESRVSGRGDRRGGAAGGYSGDHRKLSGDRGQCESG